MSKTLKDFGRGLLAGIPVVSDLVAMARENKRGAEPTTDAAKQESKPLPRIIGNVTVFGLALMLYTCLVQNAWHFDFSLLQCIASKVGAGSVTP